MTARTLTEIRDVSSDGELTRESLIERRRVVSEQLPHFEGNSYGDHLSETIAIIDLALRALDQAYALGVEDGASFERASEMGHAMDVDELIERMRPDAKLGAIARAHVAEPDQPPYGHLAYDRQNRASLLFAKLADALREESDHG